MTTRLARLLAITASVVAVLATLLAVAIVPAGAHAEIQETSPAPRAEIGSIGPIDMIFFSEVVSGTLTVSDLDGPIRSATGVLDGVRMLRFEVDEVTEAGTYRIDVAYVSADGDDNARAWTVTVVDGAPEAVRLSSDAATPIGKTGTPVSTIVAIAVLFACTVALVVLLLRRASRRLADADEPAHEPAEPKPT